MLCTAFVAVMLGEAPPLANVKPLAPMTDASAEMVAGIGRFLERKTTEARAERSARWHYDFASVDAYVKSIDPARQDLATAIGAVDARPKTPNVEFIAGPDRPSLVAECERYAVHRIRWSAFGDVHGEGLLLEPKSPPIAMVVAVPDANQTPEGICGFTKGLDERSQFARLLADAGCRVVVPTLIDRNAQWSGNPRIARQTNQPHREWIYRQAYQLGRHVIGYEIQKILAAVDWFAASSGRANGPPILVVGYGEGGLLSLHAAAIDRRIAGAYVGGYFESRERLFAEPIDRNRFGALEKFGDAELAAMVFPRVLWVDHTSLNGPHRPAWSAKPGATPGTIRTPTEESFFAETKRTAAIASRLPPTGRTFFGTLSIVTDADVVSGAVDDVCPGVGRFFEALGLHGYPTNRFKPAAFYRTPNFDPAGRQHRQVAELVAHTQRLLVESEKNRRDYWQAAKPKDAATWAAACKDLRTKFRKEVIGEFADPKLPPTPHARELRRTAKWTLHEVKLDVFPDVFAWGYLLLPNDMQPDERRPVVVCQHGLEGVPEDTVTDDPKQSGFGPYQAFSARLAERGFVVFAPHNPYRGRDLFRVLQRQANPLGRSLFSVIVAQHEVITDWLGGLPFVDPQRIGFYGLSYGGKTAMRVPALVDRYCLSICSADFNEWIKKNVTVDDGYSYMFTGEYEMYEWNLGNTFNYAEMAALIAPRPFMVERGHFDGVAPDEWVAYEYAKVRRLYAELGIPERTEIEFFKGPHQIHGVGTYRFLHRHLNWPERQASQP